MGLGKGIESGLQNLQDWIDSTFQQNSMIVEWVNSLDIQPQKIVDSVMQVLQSGVNNILSSTVTVTMGIVNTAVNVSIGFVFACYILIQKEKLMIRRRRPSLPFFRRRLWNICFMYARWQTILFPALLRDSVLKQ